MFSTVIKKIPAILFIFVFSLLFFQTQAQSRVKGDIGIGLQAGQPSGLSVATYNPNGMGIDVLAAWDLNDFLYANVHGIFTRHIGNSENLHFIFGPGVYVGVTDIENSVNDRVRAGISGTAGLSLMLGRVELYGRVTPRLQLIDNTSGNIGGGLGVRYYFR